MITTPQRALDLAAVYEHIAGNSGPTLSARSKEVAGILRHHAAILRASPDLAAIEERLRQHKAEDIIYDEPQAIDDLEGLLDLIRRQAIDVAELQRVIQEHGSIKAELTELREAATKVLDCFQERGREDIFLSAPGKDAVAAFHLLRSKMHG